MSSAISEIFCTSCRIKFNTLTEYKLHLASDFHVYNAKRRTANLAPISLAMFEEKKKLLISATSSEATEHSYHCKECNKTFGSDSTYEDHLNSKKHKKNVRAYAKKLNEDSSHESDTDKTEGKPETTMDSLRISLFDNKKSKGIKGNLDYMRKKFSFYILDIDCLISLKALLYYLAEKVHVQHACIQCHKPFKTAEACQHHMVSLGHCFMSAEDFDEEYEPFYDFAATYEEDFKGKTMNDFDLNEEQVAKPPTEP